MDASEFQRYDTMECLLADARETLDAMERLFNESLIPAQRNPWPQLPEWDET